VFVWLVDFSAFRLLSDFLDVDSFFFFCGVTQAFVRWLYRCFPKDIQNDNNG
jgi:hypothetical protein